MEDSLKDIAKYKRQVESFLSATDESRDDAARDQDYLDHKQWTDAEIKTLQDRAQPPFVSNRIKAKIDYLSGIERQRRTDPKALPRNPSDEGAADAATDALRYVADNSDMDQICSDVLVDETICYGGCIVEAQERNGEFEIMPRRIPWDRFYYDEHSSEKDFSDARFKGILVWMDKEALKEEFDLSDEEAHDLTHRGVSNRLSGDNFDDKPSNWIDSKRNRAKVCQHYFLHDGVWHVTYFSGTTFLIEPRPSTYLDEFGQPQCPIEMQAPYVSRDNERYGVIRGYISSQDRINKSASKIYYNLSVRQTLGERGAVDDVRKMKTELARANGHIEVNPGKRFELLSTGDMTQGHFQLYNEAKAEIDAFGANAALTGKTEQSLSGRAIQSLQQGGLAELEVLFDGHRSWKKRVYRQIFNRVKQFWDSEKWLRITENEEDLRWVGLNQPVTRRQVLEKIIEQGGPQAEQAFDVLQKTEGDPRLDEVAGIVNEVAQMDVDIILTESPNYAVLKQEQFDTLARLAQVYGPEKVPFEALLELSDMQRKDKVKSILQPEVDPAQLEAQSQLASIEAEMGLQARQLELESMDLKNKKQRMDIAEGAVNVQQKAIETEKLEQFPTDSVNIVT